MGLSTLTRAQEQRPAKNTPKEMVTFKSAKVSLQWYTKFKRVFLKVECISAMQKWWYKAFFLENFIV